ncbi:MAG: FAD-binding protein [Candidatus Gastranaerophilales bacterium]|nr:FAD-binding protein [Candidatus Gastranaerophilales bacterium]
MIKTINNTENNLKRKFEKILGEENVLTSKEDCIMYATDSTAVSTDLYLPDYILFPENTEQISEIMKIAYENSVPVTVRGAGTNMTGACVPFKGGIILSINKMNKILDFDKLNQTIKVQTGVIVGDLQNIVEKEGLFYPPDPSNLKVSTIGGSLALSSSGSRAFKYGGTKDYVLDLTVVLSTGEIIKTGSNTIKNATGFNLTQLFIGSEGTLGVITEATFRLIPKPEETNLILVYFDKIENAANAINGIILNKIVSSVLDIMDKVTMETIEKFSPCGLLTDNEAALFIELDGNKTVINKEIKQIIEICEEFNATKHKTAKTEEEKANLWKARRSAFAAVTQLRPNVLSEDMVVPRSKMPEMIKKTYEIGEKYNLDISIVGHAGDGNFHPHIAFDMRDIQETERVNGAVKELFLKAIELGGKISGEHGIGAVKAKYLKYSVDPFTLKYMKEIKKLFDPKNIMNPQKVFDYEIK